MTYTEKELDQFLHGISLSLLSKKSAQHWRYDEETAKEIEWLEALERKVRADKADRKTENSSEKPNNCEHITEDGVTCAKYPACDDCLNNPLNKVKGSERLVKGSEQTEPTISKMEQVDKDINVRSKEELRAGEMMTEEEFDSMLARVLTGKDEPQTNADQHVQHVGSVESVEPTWTKEEHEAFYTFLWNVINPNEMQDYIGMFETKDEPQTERSE